MEKAIKGESYKVLVVEDDKVTRETIEDFLQHQNLSIKTASDGCTALDLVKDEKFDIIITDLKMSGMNGIDILRAVKEIEPDVIVIFVTGYATVETAIEAMRQGAYDYVTKPFSLEELLIVIRNACERVNLKKQNNAMLNKLRKSYEEIDWLKSQRSKLRTRKSDIIEQTTANENNEDIVNELKRLAWTAGSARKEDHENIEDIINELEKLAGLRESGLITDEEIKVLKKKFF